MYGCGSHLGHLTRSICIDYDIPIISSLHMKFEFNWPSGSLENYVLIC